MTVQLCSRAEMASKASHDGLNLRYFVFLQNAEHMFSDFLQIEIETRLRNSVLEFCVFAPRVNAGFTQLIAQHDVGSFAVLNCFCHALNAFLNCFVGMTSVIQ